MNSPGNKKRVNTFCEGSIRGYSLYLCAHFPHFPTHLWILSLCRANKVGSLLLKLVHAWLMSGAGELCAVVSVTLANFLPDLLAWIWASTCINLCPLHWIIPVINCDVPFKIDLGKPLNLINEAWVVLHTRGKVPFTKLQLLSISWNLKCPGSLSSSWGRDSRASREGWCWGNSWSWWSQSSFQP